jgi:hypothetical protein
LIVKVTVEGVFTPEEVAVSHPAPDCTAAATCTGIAVPDVLSTVKVTGPGGVPLTAEVNSNRGAVVVKAGPLVTFSRTLIAWFCPVAP